MATQADLDREAMAEAAASRCAYCGALQWQHVETLPEGASDRMRRCQNRAECICHPQREQSAHYPGCPKY